MIVKNKASEIICLNLIFNLNLEDVKNLKYFFAVLHVIISHASKFSDFLFNSRLK